MTGEPLSIREQGSLEAGGQLVWCEHNDGGDRHSPRWGPGHVSIGHIYASYQYPVNQRHPCPILLCPGGGHTARVYDTTPDGREGWSSLLLREGFGVYNVDWPNSGRSGTDIRGITDVRLGIAEVAALPAINRYSAESAWVIFRWGPKPGEAFPDSQFPVDFADTYYRQLVSTHRPPTEAEDIAAGFAAMIDKVEPCLLLTWSGSGLPGYLAAARRKGKVKGIVAIETSVTAFDHIKDEEAKALINVPIVIVIGDRAPDRIKASRAFEQRMNAMGGNVTVDVLPDAGIRGNGHTLMLEKNNAEIMQRFVNWIAQHVVGP
jgi:pimeloyl-ACP methyl ester carboxylesterase